MLNEDLAHAKLSFNVKYEEEKVYYENIMANNSLEYHKTINDNKNSSDLKINSLESKLQEIIHENNDIKNKYSILLSENDILISEKNLSENIIIDNKKQIELLTISFKEIKNTKEDLDTVNFALKDNEIKLNNRIEFVTKEINALMSNLDNQIKLNNEVTYDLSKANKNISNNNIEIDTLKHNLNIFNEKIELLREQLDEKILITSELTIEKEKEITELNKFLNETVSSQNMKLIE